MAAETESSSMLKRPRVDSPSPEQDPDDANMAEETGSSSMPKRPRVDSPSSEHDLDDSDNPNDPDDDNVGTCIHVLDSKIEELWEELNNLKEKGQLTEGKTQSLGVTIHNIKEELRKLNDDYNSTIKLLKQKVNDLEEKLGQFQKESDKLCLGQTASVFEQALCSHVLPEVFQKDNFASIKELMRYLSGKKGLPIPLRPKGPIILSDAKKRWDELYEKIEFPAEWKTESGLWEIKENDEPPDLAAIGILKQERIPVAHPIPISLTRAKEIVLSDWYKESLPEWQYPVVKQFICSVPEKLHKGNLQHQNIIGE